eukprot:TRINITY_DN12083_c0_g2_i2.p1 TRINITY_DN12083_c0_g2~~TRINITY_DN12083_c0_g2_i2.p1  ORF type:complete len:424 (-),score=101.64 TRINITY_DN12083_c0_g2_i2:81-1352(-)
MPPHVAVLDVLEEGSEAEVGQPASGADVLGVTSRLPLAFLTALTQSPPPSTLRNWRRPAASSKEAVCAEAAAAAAAAARGAVEAAAEPSLLTLSSCSSTTPTPAQLLSPLGSSPPERHHRSLTTDPQPSTEAGSAAPTAPVPQSPFSARVSAPLRLTQLSASATSGLMEGDDGERAEAPPAGAAPQARSVESLSVRTQEQMESARESLPVRRTLLERPLEEWSVEDTASFISGLTVAPSEVVQLVRKHAICGLVLLSLTERDLDGLDIKTFGHRRLLLLGAEALRHAQRRRQNGLFRALSGSATPPMEQHAEALEAFGPSCRRAAQPVFSLAPSSQGLAELRASQKRTSEGANVASGPTLVRAAQPGGAFSPADMSTVPSEASRTDSHNQGFFVVPAATTTAVVAPPGPLMRELRAQIKRNEG